MVNLELLEGLLSTTALPPLREVSQSSSRTAIVPGADGRLALMSETRQTIAPVTLFKGTAAQFTVEVTVRPDLVASFSGATQARR